jgi:putative hydrolase of the HAD superfamily
MPALPAGAIRGIVFDLDGTLYFCEAFADTIQDAAVKYIADLLGIKQTQACQLMADTRARLSEESGTVQTLSAVCNELGGNIMELHRYFTENLQPEAHLVRDERVLRLLERLAVNFSLYIYTNNNRALANRIIDHLGFEGLFRRVFAIDDDWQAKPDEQALAEVLAETGLEPAEALFVGDRYDVDLRVPEQYGCPVYLTRNVEQLLRLGELLASHDEVH